MDYEWLMEYTNKIEERGEGREERLIRREYQEHMGGGGARQEEWEVGREPLGLNSGEHVRMPLERVWPMGRLWRSRTEMGRRRLPSPRPASRSRSGSRPVLAPLLRRYG